MSASSSPASVRVCVDEVGHPKWWSRVLRKAAMLAVVSAVIVSITSVLDPRDGAVRWLLSVLCGVYATMIVVPRAGLWLWQLRQGRTAFVLPPVRRWPAILGWFTAAALLFMLPATIIMAMAAFLAFKGGAVALVVLGPLLIWGAKPLFFASDLAVAKLRRFASVHARDLMQADHRPPVLLLRSFADDNLLTTSVSPRWGGNDAKTFEEVITERLRPFGPVVAIGRPGEQVPAAGAAREYLTDATWQERVEELVRQALAIVVVAGNTPGLRWELQRIEAMGAIRKLLIVVPGDDTGESGTILAALANTVGGTRIGAAILGHVHEDAAVVFLGDDQVLEFATSRRTAREFGLAVHLGMRKLLEARRDT